MVIKKIIKKYLPNTTWQFLRRMIGRGPSKGRRQANKWLRLQAAEITGRVLSLGSGSDQDKEGAYYRNYFKNSTSYTTSDFSKELNCDLVLDVRSMPELQDNSFDCVFCVGVLEHVDDYQSAIGEITRVLKKNGIFFLSVPFRQAIHMEPNDYWRFTEYGLRFILSNNYKIMELLTMDDSKENMPAAYLVKAKKYRRHK